MPEGFIIFLSREVNTSSKNALGANGLPTNPGKYITLNNLLKDLIFIFIEWNKYFSCYVCQMVPSYRIAIVCIIATPKGMNANLTCNKITHELGYREENLS